MAGKATSKKGPRKY